MEFEFRIVKDEMVGDFLTDSTASDQAGPSFSPQEMLQPVGEFPTDDLSVRSGLEKQLKELPASIRESPLAILALQLAGMIDRGIRVPECSRELRQCLAELKALPAMGSTGDTVDQIKQQREKRRTIP